MWIEGEFLAINMVQFPTHVPMNKGITVAKRYEKISGQTVYSGGEGWKTRYKHVDFMKTCVGYYLNNPKKRKPTITPLIHKPYPNGLTFVIMTPIWYGDVICDSISGHLTQKNTKNVFDVTNIGYIWSKVAEDAFVKAKIIADDNILFTQATCMAWEEHDNIKERNITAYIPLNIVNPKWLI